MLRNGLLFQLVNVGLRFGEDRQSSAMIGPKIGEKDSIDAVGRKASPLMEAGGQCGCRQARIDEDVPVAGPDQGCRGMSGSQILRLIPQTVAAESADADD